MNKLKKVFSALLALLIAMVFVACAKKDAQSDTVFYPAVSVSAEEPPQVSFDVEAKAGDGYSSADTVVVLADGDIKITGAGAFASGNILTVTAQGTYLLSGKLSDGQIIVNTADTSKVKLVFNGVDIYCSDNAPVYVVSAPKKVILYTVSGSVNIIKDNSSYNVDVSDSDAPSAAVFSMEDLKLDGEGEMYVSAHFNKGIMSKDDLEISGGRWFVSAPDDGIRGKDSVEMTGGYVSVEAGADGLRSSKDGEGYITVSGGELYIKAEQDGIQAEAAVTVNGGKIVISCGGGSANGSKTSESWGQWGKPGGSSPSVSADSASAKGIKGGVSVIIAEGSISIDSSDDGIHSNGTVTVSGGGIYISSGDDGIHADDTLGISGGVIEISKSYEGIEATILNLSGGTVYITASDDGINAAGGKDSSSVGGRPGQNNFTGGSGKINLTGSNIVVNADGDGIDANGSIVMSAGTVAVFGPVANNNGALDFDGTFTISGGTLLAVGSSGMAQAPSGSGQKVIKTSVSVSAGQTVCIKNSSGTELAVFKLPKNISSVVFSSPDLASGTCTIYSGGNYSGSTGTGFLTGGVYSGGSKAGSVNA